MIDKFRAKFVEESTDNVQDLEEALLILEKDMDNKDLIERIFRAMHSLKGGGAMFGFNHLSDFTHHLETLFDWVRNGKLKVSSDLISLTFEAIDQIRYLLKTGDLTAASDLQDLQNFIHRIEAFTNNTGSQASAHEKKTETTQVENASATKTYLISFIPQEDLLQNGTNPFYLLDDLHALGKAVTIAYTQKIPSLDLFEPTSNYTNWQILLSTEQPENEIRDVFIFVEDECELHIDQVANYSIIDLPEIKALIEKAASSNIMLRKEDFKQEQWQSQQQSKEQVTDKSKGAANKEHKISSIRVSSHKIDQLVNLVSELVTLQAQLELYADQHEDPAIASISENVQKLSRQLRENAFEISLIPLQSELMRFQRLVRDLSKEQGKEIDFIIEGGELELDKNIIEHLTDPILHILRNSIDHGIELPDERIAAGKSPKGIIHFKAYHSGANVFIEITDDGKGIDASVIRQKAISKGIIDADTQMSDKEVMDLIFVSGFSTRDVVSGVSGRGVGMDVVRRKIAGIRGEVSVESELGKGTLISIKLPLTLSIIDGLLVAVGNSRYVIPISSIDKIYSLAPQDLKRSFNNVIQIDNQQKPFLDLREVFNVNRDAEIEDDVVKMIMVKAEDKFMGLVVDAIIGEYQTVVKPLGRYLRKQKIVSGASIMGDGTIALVIDTSRMVQHRKSSKVSAV